MTSLCILLYLQQIYQINNSVKKYIKTSPLTQLINKNHLKKQNNITAKEEIIKHAQI